MKIEKSGGVKFHIFPPPPSLNLPITRSVVLWILGVAYISVVRFRFGKCRVAFGIAIGVLVVLV